MRDLKCKKITKLGEDLEKLLKKLDSQCFPLDTPYDFRPEEEHHIWTIETVEKEIIAYASLKMFSEDLFFFSRVGVIPKFRRKGIHSFLIKKRVDFLKKKGYKRGITYTMVDNFQSSNNLIRSGFRLCNWGDGDKSKNILWWEVKL